MRRTWCFPPLWLAALSCALTAPTAARAADNRYELTNSLPRATAGVKTTGSVTIAGKNGWHVNEQAPISMQLAPDPGVTVAKTKLTKADLAERSAERARFEVTFTAAEPGRRTIRAEASFVVCQATACIPIREKIAMAIEVGPPATAADKHRY